MSQTNYDACPLNNEDYHLLSKVILNFILNVPFDSRLNNYIQKNLKIEIKFFKLIKRKNKSHIKSKEIDDFHAIKNALINNVVGFKKISYDKFGTYYGQEKFDSVRNFNIPHGFGLMRYNHNPDYYFGNWVNGKRDGIGGIFYICGYSWSGYWEDDIRKDDDMKSSNYTLRKLVSSKKRKFEVSTIMKINEESLFYTIVNQL